MWEEAALCDSWVRGLRRCCLYVVDSVLPRCRYRYRRVDLTVAGERLQHRDDLGFGVGVEESARGRAGVGKAEAVGAQGDVAAGDPWPDLFGHRAHPVRDGDERAR